MNKLICLDCLTRFEAPVKKEMPDYTGFDGIIIEVCPVCISSHIEDANNYSLLALDVADVKQFGMIVQYFIDGCKRNKASTTDPILNDHYRALITNAETIFTNIKPCK